MFYVSALLPDDALKPATSLTNGMINETLRQFATLRDNSQSSAATHLRCVGIFSDSIIANFILILTVNNLQDRLIFDRVKAYKNIVPIFGPPCILTLQL